MAHPAPHPDERLSAPAHVIDLILGVPRPRPGPAGAGTVDYARALRAEARVYADLIWSEAWHAGAAWGLARNTRIEVQVTTERFAELARKAG